MPVGPPQGALELQPAVYACGEWQSPGLELDSFELDLGLGSCCADGGCTGGGLPQARTPLPSDLATPVGVLYRDADGSLFTHGDFSAGEPTKTAVYKSPDVRAAKAAALAQERAAEHQANRQRQRERTAQLGASEKEKGRAVRQANNAVACQQRSERQRDSMAETIQGLQAGKLEAEKETKRLNATKNYMPRPNAHPWDISTHAEGQLKGPSPLCTTAWH